MPGPLFEPLEARVLLSGTPVVQWDFQVDQSLGQLQADGWQVDARVLNDQDGVDDFRAINGVLELTDDDATTGDRFEHTATHTFAAQTEGYLLVSAGAGGSYSGNPHNKIILRSGNQDLATITLKNNTEGSLQAGGAEVLFTDASWHGGFRDFIIEWSVDANGQNGTVSLSFIASNGSVTQAASQPFNANGVPDGVKLKAGWSSVIDSTLRVDSLEVFSGQLQQPTVAPVLAAGLLFDIAVGASGGDPVIGRVNLQAPTLSGAPTYAIVGGTGSGLFEIDAVLDLEQRSYGEISVAPGQTLSQATTYTLDVQATNLIGASAIQSITVNVVNEVAINQIRDALLGAVRSRAANISDTTVADWMSKVQANGSFSDLSSSQWTEFAQRLGSLAEAYGHSSLYQGDATLKGKLYDAVEYWADNVSGNGGSHIYTSWVWPMQIATVGYYLHDEIHSEMKSADTATADRAREVNDAILDGSESAFTANLGDEFFWGGNHAYRLQAMQTRASFINDYNRPSTYSTALPRGFVPTGSFADVQYLMEQSFLPSADPSLVGMTLDGAFTQHNSGEITQNYMFGYGHDWVNNIAAASGRVDGTPWELDQQHYDILADFLLDGMQWQVYREQADYLGHGRAAGSQFAKTNYDATLVKRMNQLINFAGPGSLTRYDELVAARDAWQTGNGPDLEGSLALWNHDQIVHRRDNFYISTKLNSTRSAGNETGNNNNKLNYHMGDGLTLILVDGTEYANARLGWDWHQLPGTTAEARTDTLPIRNWNDSMQGLNDFAGVLSDGDFGISAFINDRYDAGNSKYTYHTVNSHKAGFYFEDAFVALGSGIDRVGSGQSNAVRTTLNQAEWRSDVTYNVGSGQQTRSQGSFSTNNYNVSSTAWFHQDGVGYVILPASGQSVDVRMETRQTNNNWQTLDSSNPSTTQQVDIFQLGIDHGINPSTGQYQYLIVPDIAANAMQAYVDQLDIDIVVNTTSAQAVRHNSSQVTQIVFYQAGSVDLGGGLVVTSDRPALVMLNETPGGMSITTSDPMHSTSQTQITLTVSQSLQGTGASWDPTSGVSTITVNTSNDITLAGKPVNMQFTTAPALEGDITGDGFVGLDDLDVILANWNQNVPVGDHGSGDIAGIGDGYIGLSDLDVVLGNWNSGTPPVAEPASAGAIPVTAEAQEVTSAQAEASAAEITKNDPAVSLTITHQSAQRPARPAAPQQGDVGALERGSTSALVYWQRDHGRSASGQMTPPLTGPIANASEHPTLPSLGLWEPDSL